MASKFYIGQRLSYDGRLCTVRYRGDVQGTNGEWLGVEWDDTTRGKHAGEHQGVKYFTCLHPSPTAASFIRPTRKPDSPRSFTEALKSKYAPDPDFFDPDVQIVFTTQPGNNQKALKDHSYQVNKPIKISGKIAEEVGFDKIAKQLAQLDELKIVILDGLRMWRPDARVAKSNGEIGEWLHNGNDIKSACPKVMELDLSRNLFEEWREIASICEGLEKLKILRVDGNRFRDTSLTGAEQERCLIALHGITTFKLEENFLSWEDLTRLTWLFPSLSTFSASSNLYGTLTPHELNATITDLTLEDNRLSSLSAISSLSRLPNLKRLILKLNKISETGDSVPAFPKTLTEVDLSFNDISTWGFIDRLEYAFPGLTSLRVSHNPLYETLQAPDGRALTADDGYMLTLARLGNLQTLNHSPITAKERLNAESYYLSTIAKQVQFAPEAMREQILKSHPRYTWLCEEYGEPDIHRSSNAVNPNSLAARLIKIQFYLASDESNTYEEEIPMSFTAYTVLGLVGKRFGIMPMKCKLIWETGDWIHVKRSVVDFGNDDWNSDEDSEAQEVDRIMREVEVVPGTRSIRTWIDGSEAVVRVEIKDTTGA